MPIDQAEVRRIERKYTRYRDDSVTARINASAGREPDFELDDETVSLLDYAATAWEQSEGLFDITSDGERVLVNDLPKDIDESAETRPRITVVLNWFEALRQQVGGH